MGSAVPDALEEEASASAALLCRRISSSVNFDVAVAADGDVRLRGLTRSARRQRTPNPLKIQPMLFESL
jgi:hypothetical protein